MVMKLLKRVGSAIYNLNQSEFKYTYYCQSFTLLSVVKKKNNRETREGKSA